MSRYVPYATRRRLPIYYKLFKSLVSKNYLAITSAELSELIKIDSTTIRRDFAAIGKLGKKGIGYPIKSIIEIFENEFGLTELEGVVLVGLGDLGSAVTKYFDTQDSVSYLSQVYDIDPNKIGQTFKGLEVLDHANISETIDKNCHIAIIAVPGDKAQFILNELVELGIKGFVNFSGSKVFHDDKSIIIRDIDVMQVIQSIIYDMRTGY